MAAGKTIATFDDHRGVRRGRCGDSLADADLHFGADGERLAMQLGELADERAILPADDSPESNDPGMKGDRDPLGAFTRRRKTVSHPIVSPAAGDRVTPLQRPMSTGGKTASTRNAPARLEWPRPRGLPGRLRKKGVG